MKNGFKMILAVTVIACFAFIKPNANEIKKTITVVIDAGHGGDDHGMKINNFTEKEIVASIAQKIKKNNADGQIIIHLTRTEDDFISLEDRAKFINKVNPDLVLSLHVNGNENKEASGIELYVSPKSSSYKEAKNIAEDLNTRLIANHNLKSRGVKDANFTLLKQSEHPSITVELGFLSNEKDQKYLTDQNEQEKIAATILEALAALK